MPQLEFFFDYACPYCLRGHTILAELLPRHPQVRVLWRPCEAHPRPGRWGPHSDLCARGMFFARDNGADLPEYHRRVYAAIFTDRLDVERIDNFVRALDGLLDIGALGQALQNGAYLPELAENNRLAWEEYRFDAVPSCRADGLFLRSIEDVGLKKKALDAFLQQIY